MRRFGACDRWLLRGSCTSYRLPRGDGTNAPGRRSAPLRGEVLGRVDEPAGRAGGRPCRRDRHGATPRCRPWSRRARACPRCPAEAVPRPRGGCRRRRRARELRPPSSRVRARSRWRGPRVLDGVRDRLAHDLVREGLPVGGQRLGGLEVEVEAHAVGLAELLRERQQGAGAPARAGRRAPADSSRRSRAASRLRSRAMPSSRSASAVSLLAMAPGRRPSSAPRRHRLLRPVVQQHGQAAALGVLRLDELVGEAARSRSRSSASLRRRSRLTYRRAFCAARAVKSAITRSCASSVGENGAALSSRSWRRRRARR